MLTVHVQALEVRTDVKSNWVNKLLIQVQNSATKQGSETTVVDSRLFRTCTFKWSLAFQDTEQQENAPQGQQAQNIQIFLRQRRVFSRNDEIGKVTLPLCWFPQDKVVREWFPMRSNGQITAMILLDVHVSTKGGTAFEAPFAQLTVLPAWSRPMDRFAPFQPPPAVIVVSNNVPPESQPFVPPVACGPWPAVAPPSFGVSPPSFDVPASSGSSFGVPDNFSGSPFGVPGSVNPYAMPDDGIPGPFPVIQDSSGCGEIGSFIPQYYPAKGYAPPVQPVDFPTVEMQMSADPY